ncbi:hypothetical protein BA896_021920 [Janthinobacterium lividum]|uniref:Uncharacterized protein n=1 Tax=Janthinobacterium lividum TaxID=29581 RepID=A0A1E8PJG3_9BURK|nr:hypothetical protein BA896_021920 [Janthinobacterium lividum]
MMNSETTILQQLLQQMHVPQAELAKYSGVSPATVSLAVRHNQYPKRDADALRRQFKSFFDARCVAPETIAAALGNKKAEVKVAPLTPACCKPRNNPPTRKKWTSPCYYKMKP